MNSHASNLRPGVHRPDETSGGDFVIRMVAVLIPLPSATEADPRNGHQVDFRSLARLHGRRSQSPIGRKIDPPYPGRIECFLNKTSLSIMSITIESDRRQAITTIRPSSEMAVWRG